MNIQTAEQIVKATDDMPQRQQQAAINRAFRQQDDSHLWPIRGKFNVTERAIRYARRFERESGCAMDPLEYALFLETEMGRIVNGESNL